MVVFDSSKIIPIRGCVWFGKTQKKKMKKKGLIQAFIEDGGYLGITESHKEYLFKLDGLYQKGCCRDSWQPQSPSAARNSEAVQIYCPTLHSKTFDNSNPITPRNLRDSGRHFLNGAIKQVQRHLHVRGCTVKCVTQLNLELTVPLPPKRQ